MPRHRNGWDVKLRLSGIEMSNVSEMRPSSEEPKPKAKLQKVTLYVRPEQILRLEEIQVDQRRRTGRRPDKSELVQEALDLLIQCYTQGA